MHAQISRNRPTR